MAKIKITLGKVPDFKLPVAFKMPGGEEAEIIFTVRHHKANEIQELYNDDKKPMKDGDLIMHLASGWDLDEEFNAENAAELIALFPGVSLALMREYMMALVGQRAKN